MLDLNLLPLYLVAVTVLVVTPGPDTLFVIAHTLAGGARRGMLATLGIAAGIAVHSALAALGIAAIVATSPALFEGIKIIGGLYLLYIGVMSLRAAMRPPQQGGAAALPEAQSASRVFWQAAVTNLLNPKVLIFFLAFLPQFVNPKVGPVAMQMLVLGVIFGTLGSLYLVAVCAVTGKITGLLRRHRWVARALEWVSGLVFIGLAARMLLDRRGLA
jgi:threonine/homoserine/homoserine lactone efflux protein